MHTLQTVSLSVTAVRDGQKTPALKLLEDPEFNYYGGDKGLTIERLPDMNLGMINARGPHTPDIPWGVRDPIPSHLLDPRHSKNEVVQVYKDIYMPGLFVACLRFGEKHLVQPPRLRSDDLVGWDDTAHAVDCLISYPGQVMGCTFFLGPTFCTPGSFSALDKVDPFEPLCLVARRTPENSDSIALEARLPTYVTKGEESEVSRLVLEMMNAAAVAWRTRTRASIVVRHAEYIVVTYQPSSVQFPIPKIFISKVQMTASNALSPLSPYYSWAFTALNIAFHNISERIRAGDLSSHHLDTSSADGSSPHQDSDAETSLLGSASENPPQDSMAGGYMFTVIFSSEGEAEDQREPERKQRVNRTKSYAKRKNAQR